MTRWLTIATWLLFFAMAYLFFSETVAPWLTIPALGNVGFTLVFVLFALLHCALAEGPRFTAEFFAISAVISYALEEAGVRTGLIFGGYHYSDMLGAKLGHVPVIIPLAWFMMIYPCWAVARTLLCGLDTRSWGGLTTLSLVAALVITGWDMVMDPGMAAAHNWVWEHGGAYFGVPLRNYAGWVFTTFVIYWLSGLIWRNRPRAQAMPGIVAAQPQILYALYALRYVITSRIPALRAVAVFSMGLPALLALLRLWMRRDGLADSRAGD